MIRYSKGLGFSQTQIKDLVALAGRENLGCEKARAMVETQSTAIAEKIKSLEELQHCLTKMAAYCQQNEPGNCSAFDDIKSGSKF